MNPRSRFHLVVAAAAVSSGLLHAEVKPNILFTDGAVLQRGQAVPGHVDQIALLGQGRGQRINVGVLVFDDQDTSHPVRPPDLGRRMMKVEPSPSVDSTATAPP